MDSPYTSPKSIQFFGILSKFQKIIINLPAVLLRNQQTEENQKFRTQNYCLSVIKIHFLILGFHTIVHNVSKNNWCKKLMNYRKINKYNAHDITITKTSLSVKALAVLAFHQSGTRYHNEIMEIGILRHAIVASQTCELAQNSQKIWAYSSSGSSKMDDFGTNRKRTCMRLPISH